jgi:hypothetical protein
MTTTPTGSPTSLSKNASESGASRIDLTGGGAGTEPSLGQLIASASRDLTTLVHNEIALAKAELKDDVKHGAKGGAMFGVAGYLALLATVLLSIAAAYGLHALGLPLGWAFLIVAVVYLLVAGILAMVGKKQIARVKPPEKTIKTTKESVSALKGHSS